MTKVDFKDPKWNRDTYARMDADLDPTKEKLGWLKGTAYGVRDNEKVRPLFAVEGFSLVRTKRLEDGSWRRMLREIVFYRDLETGKILETWRNPYTDKIGFALGGSLLVGLILSGFGFDAARAVQGLPQSDLTLTGVMFGFVPGALNLTGTAILAKWGHD